MQDLNGYRVAILATDGYERSELMTPRGTFREAGAAVDVVLTHSPRRGCVRLQLAVVGSVSPRLAGVELLYLVCICRYQVGRGAKATDATAATEN